jgi:hypothetical protein
MMASVPSFALKRAPETGASTIAIRLAFRTLPNARVPAGSDELMSDHDRSALQPGQGIQHGVAHVIAVGNHGDQHLGSLAAARAVRQLPLPFRS